MSTGSGAEVEGSVALLNAAADPVRWTILQRLADGQACVCDLQAIVAVAPNLLSYHLKYAGPGNAFGVLVAVGIGIPLFSNAAGILPLVEALHDKGLTAATTP